MFRRNMQAMIAVAMIVIVSLTLRPPTLPLKTTLSTDYGGHEWGTKLQYKSEEKVSTNYEFQKGEYGIVRDLQLNTERAIDPNFLPTEKEVAEKVIQSFEKEEGKVFYIKMESWTKTTGGYVDHYYKYFKVVECQFKGSPLSPNLILTAIIVIAAVIGISIVFLPGVWYKLAGVSAPEALVYSIGNIGIIVALAVVAVIVVPILTRRKNEK